jgi:putative membrane protein
MLDLVLAILHHLLILTLAGLMMAGFVLAKPGLSGAGLKTLGGIDASYGGTALLILVVGFARVFLGAKGSAFYLENPVFWAKIAAFAAVGLLSIAPTIAIVKWRKRAGADPTFVAVRRRGGQGAQGDAGRASGLRPDPDLRRRHGARLWPLASRKTVWGRAWKAAPERKVNLVLKSLVNVIFTSVNDVLTSAPVCAFP